MRPARQGGWRRGRGRLGINPDRSGLSSTLIGRIVVHVCQGIPSLIFGEMAILVRRAMLINRKDWSTESGQ